MPKILDKLLKTYTCQGLYYIKGPGSFMAIKVSYIFLKTLAISLKLPLYACDGFEINENSPILAFGKNYFVKKNQEIILQKFDKEPTNNIKLPKNISDIDFTNEIEPLYILPAI